MKPVGYLLRKDEGFIMKNKIFMSVCIALCLVILGGCSSASGQNESNVQQKEEAAKIPDIKEKGTVVILATGGTIAGVGEAGKETG